MLHEPKGKCRRRGRNAAATDSVTENKPPGGSSEPPGKGEKVGQEPTAPRREAGGTKNPFRCKTK
jgi:hypothetical protein